MNKLIKLTFEENKKTFELAIKVYALDIIIRDSGFFIKEDLINPKAVKSVHVIFNSMIKDLVSVSD